MPQFLGRVLPILLPLPVPLPLLPPLLLPNLKVKIMNGVPEAKTHF